MRSFYFSVFEGPQTVSTVAAPFCVSTSRARAFHFLSILEDTRQSFSVLFSITDIGVCERWRPAVVWVWVSAVTDDAEHLPVCLLAVRVRPLENVRASPFACFLSRLFVLLSICRSSSRILDINPFSIMIYKCFLPSCGLLFPLSIEPLDAEIVIFPPFQLGCLFFL